MPAKTLGDLKKAVLAYAGRKAGDFTVDSVDYTLRAINNAKDFAQRAVDFEFARVDAYVPSVSVTNGGALSAALLYGAGTPIVVKSVKNVFLLNAASTVAFPIRMVSRDSHIARLRRRYEDITRVSDANSINQANVVPNQLTYVPIGAKFFVFPADQSALGGATFTVYLDVFQWIEDWVNDADVHWLFDYCYDFMMFRSLLELNYLMKEDMRVQISSTYMAAIWNNVVQWNATVIGSQVDDANLD